VTPRPINPATDTTNPSARATQTLNPYLGSTPEGNVVDGEIRISLEDSIVRGLRFNLGLIDSQQADAGVTAGREHALSQLLPQISARAQQSYEQLSFKALNVGYGFFLVPANIIAYSQLRPDQNNKASSLTNLFRNWGRQLWHRLHHDCIRTAGQPSSDEPRLAPGQQRTKFAAELAWNGQVPHAAWLHQRGRRRSIPWPRVPATTSSESISSLHGLLPRDWVADDNNDSAGLSHSKIQRRRGRATAH
jgi:hypothetical protein